MRQLDIQSNRLTSIGDGLNNLQSLEELYLGHNKIPNIDELSLPNPNSLSTIDLSGNPITSVAGIQRNLQLSECWMSYCGLASYEDLIPLTQVQCGLSCLYLEHNPIAADFEYRMKLKEMIPSLEQIDAVLVKRS